jgi:DNA-binding NarL/FixJ family response regulator
MRRVTVLIADDHGILREGLRKMLELDDNLEIVGEAEDGLQAIALAKQLRPNIILMDIEMPRLNGLEATREVVKALPATKVLIFSAYNDEEYVKGASESKAAGYLLKQSSIREVHRAIWQVHKGKKVFRTTIPRRSTLPARRPSSSPAPLNQKVVHLTSREMEVLRLIAQGKANKETASELGIGIKTVEKHREHLMGKLNIHETAGLTRYAMVTGIIERR